MSRGAKIVTSLARSAQRLPIGRDQAGRMAVRLRSSKTARKVVSRMFDFDDSGIGGTFFLGAGNVIGGLGLDNLPVVVVNLVGADPDAVPGLVEAVAQEQVLTGGFRPVFLIDGDYFAEIRQYDYPVDHVIPKASWPGASEDWERYVVDRLRQMRRSYSAIALVDPIRAGDTAMLFLSTLDAPQGR